MSELYDAATLGELETQIDAWLAEFAADNDVVVAVERGERDADGSGWPRWYVRMTGEDKDFTTVWITLGQRTVRFETYVMPAPEENHQQLYEQALRRNEQLVGVAFSIGIENALFLRGALPIAALSAAELDRAIGTLYATVEQHFRTFLRVGFASRFQPDQ